ncbi:MAG TPA: M14 family zinc carboxypeptidase, partial [Calditrichia bacterium]|nr:M14 family zinc carboxypeptidase [Calditrichia bacterium]
MIAHRHFFSVPLVLMLILVAALSGGSLFAQDAPGPYRQVLLNFKSPQELVSLQEAGLGLDHAHHRDGKLEVVLNPEQYQLIRRQGVDHQVLIEDMTAHYLENVRIPDEQMRDLQRSMKATYPVEGFEYGSMGGYYTFTEVLAELDSMRLLYPNLITVRQSIGTSIQGRDLWMVKISDNPDVEESEPEVLYTALHHAREPQGMMGLIYFMYHLLENYGTDPEVTYLVNNREMFFIPVLNPDGYVYNEQTNPGGGGFWRKNRRNNGDGSFGIDLNRNYGYFWGHDNVGSSPSPSSETYRGTGPFSEPETQAIRDFANAHNFHLALNYHTYGDWLIYPWGYVAGFRTPDSTTFETLAANMTQFNGYTYGTADETVGYIVNGDSDDWLYGEQTTKNKILALTPEVGPSFWPSQSEIYPLAQENIYPNMQLALGPDIILGDPSDPLPVTNAVSYSDYTTPTTVALTWTDPLSLVDGTPLGSGDFTVEVSRDGVPVASVPGGDQNFTDTGLSDGQSYSYDLIARVTATDSTSEVVSLIQVAGGALQPNPPTNLVVLDGGAANTYWLRWRNPATNIDGTPMDDLAGINVYQDGSLVTTVTRTSADSGRLDSTLYVSTIGTHLFRVSAIDNETPANESERGNGAYTPIGLPFSDSFLSGPEPNPGFWINQNAQVTASGVNPPSPPLALTLNGDPDGGDQVDLLPVDLAGQQGNGVLLAFWYQPGGSVNDPETGDSLRIHFLNDQGRWVRVRAFPGTPQVPFAQESIALDAADPGPGATFFHAAFSVRFSNLATTGDFDLWLIDDVFLGVPSADPQMVVSPASLSDTLLSGATASLEIRIANANTNPSTLNFAIAESPAVDWLSATPASGTVASNGSETIAVEVNTAGLAAGDYQTELVVTGNDSNNPEQRVAVAIHVQDAPVALVGIDSINFRLNPDAADTSTFYLFNTGAGELRFSISDEATKLKRRVSASARKHYPDHFYGMEPGKGEADPRRGTPAVEGAGGPDAFG